MHPYRHSVNQQGKGGPIKLLSDQQQRDHSQTDQNQQYEQQNNNPGARVHWHISGAATAATKTWAGDCERSTSNRIARQTSLRQYFLTAKQRARSGLAAEEPAITVQTDAQQIHPDVADRDHHKTRDGHERRAAPLPASA